MVRIIAFLLGVVGLVLWLVYVFVPLLDEVRYAQRGEQSSLIGNKTEVQAGLQTENGSILVKRAVKLVGKEDLGRPLTEVRGRVGEYLEVKLRLEESLRGRIVRQLEPLTGDGRVQVSVFADLRAGGSEEDFSEKAYLELAESRFSETQIERLSISLLLGRRPVAAVAGEGLGAGYDEWSTWEQRQIEQLVKGAVGFNEARGDTLKMAILTLEGDAKTSFLPLVSKQSVADTVKGSTLGIQPARGVFFLGGSLGLLLLLVLLVILPTSNKKHPLPPESHFNRDDNHPESNPFGSEFDAATFSPVAPVRRQAISAAKEDPQTTARILEEWLS